MFFKNLTFFRFPIPSPDQIRSLFRDHLDMGTAECQLKPAGPMELSSRGFISPTGWALAPDDRLPYWRDDKVWLTVGGEDRIIPGSVVNNLLAKKLAEIEQKEGRKPGGRARKRIKDELIVDLLPRAFIKPSRIDGYLDLGRGLVVVDTASRKVAENFVSEVRRALGSFPALPINPEVAPRAVMTDWVVDHINGSGLPYSLAIGDEATLADPIEQGAVVRVSRMELASVEINQHLESGKQVTRLGLSLDDHVAFTLDETLAVRKFKLLDSSLESLENVERDDLQAELDARFFLLTSEVGRLFDALGHTFKLSKVEA